MIAPGPGSEPDKVRSRATGMFAQLVDDARAAEYEDVRPEDHDRLFYKLVWWKRVVIMGSGVTINLVLAVLFFCAAFMGIGVNTATTTVGTVSQCVKVVTAGTEPGKCTSADKVAPALRAGIRPGDTVTSFNGTAIASYQQLQEMVRANEGSAAAIGILRGGKALTLHTDTTINVLPNLNDPERTVRAGFLGITPVLARERQGFGFVVSTMAN